MSDYDDDFDGDNFDYDDDFDGYDSELSEEDHKFPQEGETNFVCIDASSPRKTPQVWTQLGECFLFSGSI